MSVIQKDLGAATAYALAVEGGYTGTQEQYEALLASYATVAEEAAASAAEAKAAEQGAINALAEADSPVAYGIEQTLTEAQKTQARSNIGAMAADAMEMATAAETMTYVTGG